MLIIQELGELGGSAEGCYERRELEERLLQSRREFEPKQVEKKDTNKDKAHGGQEAAGQKEGRLGTRAGEKLQAAESKGVNSSQVNSSKVVNLEPVIQATAPKEELREEVGRCVRSGRRILVGDD